MDNKSNGNELNLVPPHKIKEYLDEHVIGQDDAKKVLSVAIYNHYKRMFSEAADIQFKNDKFSDLNNVEIDKSNIICLGDSGTGKTLLVKTIAKLLNIPCYISDATSLTQSGYVGDDVETMLTGLLQACEYDVRSAEMGIVIIDEADKLASKNDSPSITRDVGGEGVQQALLKIVEGNVIGVPPNGGRKHPEQPLIYVNTKNILFIAIGAFVGIEQKIKKRINYQPLGFASATRHIDITDNEILSFATAEDLRSYGMIPELIGRFPIITHTNQLREDDLIRILKEPKNALIKQFKKLLLLDNKELVFDDEALCEIAKVSLKLKIGARGLRAIMENIMTDIMYNAPQDKDNDIIQITKTHVDHILDKTYRHFLRA